MWITFEDKGKIMASLPPALFVAAHCDDELLSMGVAIAEHCVADRDVHILWMTAGGNTSARNVINGSGASAWWGVPHHPEVEGYEPLTSNACGQARLREAENSVRVLASPGRVTIHHGGLVSESLTQTFNQADAQAAILAVVDAIAPGEPVHLKGHTWLVDNHPDHLAVGAAIKALNAADPVRFAAPRYYVQPSYWADPRLSQVAGLRIFSGDLYTMARVRAAARAYGAWAPPHTYAIGQHSAPALFATINANPKCLYHI